MGIVDDIRRKIPHYISDFTECLNLQCVATTMYIYLVSLCSLVAFGGMLGQKTNNLMVIKHFCVKNGVSIIFNEYTQNLLKATMECILAGAVCGGAFALFSGQPLNIISATGPMLILESIIFNLCE